MNSNLISYRNRIFFLKEFLEVDNLGDYIGSYLGEDFRRVHEEGIITPYIENLMKESAAFKYQKQGREDIEILRELIYSRCVEHYLMAYFGDLALCGSDKDCILTKYSTHFPDLKSKDGNYYEVVCCSFGQFSFRNYITITESKLNYLCDFSSKNKTYLLLVDIMYCRYWKIEILPNFEGTPINSTENKLNHIIKIPINEIEPMDFERSSPNGYIYNYK